MKVNEVPRRFARAVRLQSLYQSGYQDALDGEPFPDAPPDSHSRRGDDASEAYSAGYEAARTWLASREEASGPIHPTGETDPYWLPIWQWDTEGGAWEDALG
jgi:hypothetical protein